MGTCCCHNSDEYTVTYHNHIGRDRTSRKSASGGVVKDDCKVSSGRPVPSTQTSRQPSVDYHTLVPMQTSDSRRKRSAPLPTQDRSSPHGVTPNTTKSVGPHQGAPSPNDSNNRAAAVAIAAQASYTGQIETDATATACPHDMDTPLDLIMDAPVGDLNCLVAPSSRTGSKNNSCNGSAPNSASPPARSSTQTRGISVEEAFYAAAVIRSVSLMSSPIDFPSPLPPPSILGGTENGGGAASPFSQREVTINNGSNSSRKRALPPATLITVVAPQPDTPKPLDHQPTSTSPALLTSPKDVRRDPCSPLVTNACQPPQQGNEGGDGGDKQAPLSGQLPASLGEMLKIATKPPVHRRPPRTKLIVPTTALPREDSIEYSSDEDGHQDHGYPPYKDAFQ